MPERKDKDIGASTLRLVIACITLSVLATACSPALPESSHAISDVSSASGYLLDPSEAVEAARRKHVEVRESRDGDVRIFLGDLELVPLDPRATSAVVHEPRAHKPADVKSGTSILTGIAHNKALARTRTGVSKSVIVHVNGALVLADARG